MIAVVTGAGRGIGRAIAQKLSSSGATVVLCGRDVDALNETGRLLDGDWLAVRADVSDERSVAELADAVHASLDTPQILVCNSGIGGPSAPLWQVDLAAWQETLAVNVTGAFLTMRAFLPGMIDRRSGSIVLIGSMTGKRPLAHRSPYAASKMALAGLCRTAALDAAPHGVRVNLVSPGFVEGPRLDWVIEAQAQVSGETTDAARDRLRAEAPLDRFVAGADVADAVLFLASDQSRAIAGADINVSAGLVMY